MSLSYVGYRQVTDASPTTLKSGPAKFYGLTVIASTSGAVTIYDNTSASGTVLFTKSGLVAGDVIHFGGVGISANNGLHVVCGGTATINVMYQ
jgi:hypothetical protein